MSTSINIPTAPTLVIPQLPVYIPDAGLSRDETKLVLSLWLSSFRGPCKDIDTATSKLLTLTSIAVPEILTYLVDNRGPVRVERFRAAGYLDDLLHHRHPAGLVPDDWALDKIEDDCITVTDDRAVYSAAAVAFMTYAKQAGEGARNALESARPGALVGKYSLKDDQLGLFPGSDYGPDIEALDQANAGFSLHSTLRYLVTAFFLSLKRQHNQVPPNMDPFLVMFDLLRMTGMTHVGAITMLVEMHPWTIKVPELVPYFKRFARDLRKLNSIPEDLRAYHRLLVPQSDFLFLTSELRPLIAVAGDYVKEVEAFFSGYVYNASKYSALIKHVRALDPKVTGNPDITELARLFGIPDVNPKAPDTITPPTSAGVPV